MATYYVWSGAGGANNGTSWTDAYTALASAVTAASTAGDIIKVHKTHTEELGADTTYAITAKILIVCVDKDASDALAEMSSAAWIGSSTAGRNLVVSGTFYMYGITFRTSTALFRSMQFGDNGNETTYEKCYFWRDDDGVGLRFGTSDRNTFSRLINCTSRVKSSHTSVFEANGVMEVIGGTFIADTGSFTSMFSFNYAVDVTGTTITCRNVDFNQGGISSIAGDAAYIPARITLENCVMASGQSLIATQTDKNNSSADVLAINCAIGDEHYHLWHSNPLGETVVSTGIYANDGAEYNLAAAKYSWKITTTADCNFYTPYVSPWIGKYNEGTIAITPYLEILRDGSTTAYQDDEVWGEFSYQGTTGFTLGTIVNDRMALLGTPANQAAGAATWTGGTTPWSGKLAPGSAITPAEIGNLSARVCVGEPSITVYVDPQIRT